MKINVRQKSNQADNPINRIITAIMMLVLFAGSIAAQVVTTDEPIAETKTAKSDKPNTPPVIAKDSPDAISPYVSCRRLGRADTNHPCNAAEAQRLADEQGYELKTGPYGGKQNPKKQN